jgi:uncharacterized membrane protein (DUF2068 family)
VRKEFSSAHLFYTALKQHKSKNVLRLLSLFEAGKGLLVLLVGAGLLSLIHKDAQHEAADLVKIFHLNPARHYPEIFINTLANIGNVRLWFLSLSALVYSLIRFAEAYGLWYDRLWAIWFAVASGALFLPMEIYELIEKLTAVRIIILFMNILLVFYLFRLSRHRA